MGGGGDEQSQNFEVEKFNRGLADKQTDRDFQQKLNDIVFQQAIQKLGKEQGFTSQQNELNRGQETTLAAQQAKDALERQLTGQSFQSGESKLNRTAEAGLADKAAQDAMSRILEQEKYGAGESALTRGQELTLADKSQNAAMSQLLQGQKGASEENQKNRDLDTSQFNKKVGLYEDVLNKGSADQASGEKQFMSELSAPPSELEQLKQDLIRQSLPAQDMAKKQMLVNLKQQGVRGGQASTLLNRGQGEINQNLQTDLNKLSYDDVLNRRTAKTNFYGNKAATGQSRALTPVGV